MPVTQGDIAKRLGVSQRLVSYALNGQAGVGVAMREKIQSEAESLGYRPHRAAQALATGRTFQIALCFPWFLGSSFYSEIIRQFEVLARKTPYDLLMITLDTTSDNGGNVQFSSDGMIFVGHGAALPRNFTQPAVTIQKQFYTPCPPPAKNIDQVQLNMEHASFAAMQHLIEQGFRRIAYVAAADMMDVVEWRYQAYKAAMRNAGLNVELVSLPISNEEMIRQQSRKMLKAYFEEKGFPDAIFCGNDDIGMGAYRALGELGRRIPADTAIVGFDDLDLVDYLNPPMTSVHMPLEGACRIAWEMLMERIENNDLAPRFEALECHLVVRESSVARTREALK